MACFSCDQIRGFLLCILLCISVTGKDAPAYSTVNTVDRTANLVAYKCFFEDCIEPLDASEMPPPTER